MKANKLYVVRECKVCGDDDRYCDACVGAAVARAKPSWDLAINRAAGIGLVFVGAEFVASLLGNSWAQKGMLFSGILIGFWVGATSKTFVSGFKSPKKLSPPVRCKGKSIVINVDPKTGLGESKALGALWDQFSDDTKTQCNIMGNANCEQSLCDTHCQYVCRPQCPNKKKT